MFKFLKITGIAILALAGVYILGFEGGRLIVDPSAFGENYITVLGSLCTVIFAVSWLIVEARASAKAAKVQ